MRPDARGGPARRARRALGLALVASSAALAACTPGPPTAVARPPRSTARAAPHGTASAPSASTASSAPTGSLPARLLTVRIPGLTSHFAARDAVIYLPPAARQRPAPRLPVLLLLHGTPGNPSDWARKGALTATLDQFAARHAGRAPIVVMPDINGAPRADTECVATGSGDVERYLTEDVPRWTAGHFRVDTNPRAWAIAGMSEGGTCALMLALRHTTTFATAGDLSGLSRPTVGPHDDPPDTVRRLFHGSRAAYQQHDPLWLLSRYRYPSLGAWFACGRRDRQVVRAQAAVAQAARRAGIATRAYVVPGGHSWSVWRAALPGMLRWLWQRMVT